MKGPILKHRLFEVFGIELEYMIVDRKTLNILPITDKLFHSFAGTYDTEVDRGALSWNNELALHVFELKTTDPASDLTDTWKLFQAEVQEVNKMLAKMGARLMPTAMHPWMNPLEELRLWPHGDNPWYAQFDKIFNCKGHGWANLQSIHLNLPFGDEKEFVKLHAAIRLVLPLIPSLAASSPLAEGEKAPCKDFRLEVYKTNSKRIPSISGEVIPEAIASIQDYHEKIFHRIAADLEGHDPEKVLEPEWTNARGAIARFERNAIEIRLIDIQECPLADLAIATFFAKLAERLVERFSPAYHKLDEKRLKAILQEGIVKAEDAVIEDEEYLAFFEAKAGPAKEVFRALLPKLSLPAHYEKAIRHILDRGTLATRILRHAETHSLPEVYQTLCECLEKGEMLP